MGKRLFDIVFGTLGLIVTSPVFLICALLVKLSGPGPVFFRQERMGQGFRPFTIYKFRTMSNGSAEGPLVTANDDPRITAVGRWLRRFKLDELPQLINVVKGEMSVVGPRPEVRQYVELFRGDYETILKARPGITDEASIAFRHEEVLLTGASDLQTLYINDVLPRKIALAKHYIETANWKRDVAIILRTLVRL